MAMEGYRQDQSLCVATVHHQCRVDAQSHNGHEVTRGEQHRGHLANVTLLRENTEKQTQTVVAGSDTSANWSLQCFINTT